MASKGRGHRVLEIDGFEVLVGKGDADNDALTFGVAEPRDFWMHVAGPAGSHVVVRNPDGLDALPRSVLIRAAFPVRRVPSYGRRPQGRLRESAFDREMLEELRSLGYIQ